MVFYNYWCSGYRRLVPVLLHPIICILIHNIQYITPRSVPSQDSGMNKYCPEEESSRSPINHRGKLLWPTDCHLIYNSSFMAGNIRADCLSAVSWVELSVFDDACSACSREKWVLRKLIFVRLVSTLPASLPDWLGWPEDRAGSIINSSTGWAIFGFDLHQLAFF